MGLKNSIVLMGAATAIRLGAGLITFSVLARLLGPESFGVLMLWFSVSVLISLITNYGLTPYVLKEVGVNPDSAESITNEGLTGKLLLTAIVFSCCSVAVWWLEIELRQVFLCLLVSTVADSFTEFFNAVFRARGRYDIEARIALTTSILHATIVVSTVFMYPTVEHAAAAFSISRLTILIITVQAGACNFGPIKLAQVGVSIARLRKATGYAVDFGFQSLFGQIDSVVLNYFLGSVAVGLYQAGMRFFQIGAQAAGVLSNVFLPRAAAANKASRNTFTEESQLVQIAFILIGFCFGLMMAAFPQLIINFLFGDSYNRLIELMPFFGLLFFLRFSAGAWGVVLTSAGEQAYRAKLGFLYWLVILILAGWLVPMLGIQGWLISLCIGTVLLIIGYGIRCSNYLNRFWGISGLSLVGGVFFLPFI